MLRFAIAVILILLVGTAGVYLGRHLVVVPPVPPPSPAGTARAAPTIEQIQQLATLVTLKVTVADVLTTSAKSHVGAMHVMLVVRGDALLGTDLSRARYERCDAESRSAVLVLPHPAVTSPRLDHEQTHVAEIDVQGLWQLPPNDGARAKLINRAQAEAQAAIARAAADPTLARRARQQAHQALDSLFSAQGWSLTIRWVD